MRFKCGSKEVTTKFPQWEKKQKIPHTLCRNIKFDFWYTNSKSNYFIISKIKQSTIKLVDTQKMN